MDVEFIEYMALVGVTVIFILISVAITIQTVLTTKEHLRLKKPYKKSLIPEFILIIISVLLIIMCIRFSYIIL